MKSILIIIGNYSPRISSVANCMEPLVEKIKQHYEVDVITDRKNVEHLISESMKKITVHRIDDYISVSYSKYLKRKAKSKGISLFLCKVILGAKLAMYQVHSRPKLTEKQSEGWNISKAVNLGNVLQESKQYSAIISVSLPFKSHQIAYKIVKKAKSKPLWFVYEFDPFFYNDEIKRGPIRNWYMKTWQNRVFGKCDSILLTPELFDYYSGMNERKFSSKMEIIPFAGIEKRSHDDIIYKPSKTEKFTSVFAGRLYINIRNPEYAVKTINSMTNEMLFYIYSDYDWSSMQPILHSSKRINVNSFVERDQILDIYETSDILINIGNTVEHQVPGKLFELISTGKPIVHFSKIKNDPSLKYLSRYPLSLVIKEYEMSPSEAAQIIDSFVNTCGRYRLSNNDIQRHMGEFYGEQVKDKFVRFINCSLGVYYE